MAGTLLYFLVPRLHYVKAGITEMVKLTLNTDIKRRIFECVQGHQALVKPAFFMTQL